MTINNFKGNIVFFFIACCISLLFSCSPKEVNEIDLSGQWTFQMDSLDRGINEQWFQRQLTDLINLPGSMPEQNKGYPVGYETQFTGNTWKQYPEGKSWSDDENYKPYLSDDKFRYPFWLISDYHYVGRAWYQKEIMVPEDWQGKIIELYLERPHWETTVWVNGQNVGLQNALGMAHRYAIGKFIQAGLNQITISVDNRVKDINVGIDAHSISDNTQSNWNGIVGDIKLVKRDEIFVSNVQIYPNVENKTARLKIVVKNTSGQLQSGQLSVEAKTIGASKYHKVKSMATSFKLEAKVDTLELIYNMGDDMLLWDEFNPNVYQLSVQLDTDMASDKWEGNFGMREFKNVGKGLQNNGRPVYLRGTLDCAVFPKTGYPPTSLEQWERIIKTCKAHGLNHIRFHSWCPPKAAFEAADKLGFYYQVEASAWATNLGDSTALDQWIYDESERMVAEYGNHPSFCLMPYGNEPHGKNHRAYLVDFVRYWKAKDDKRRIYTTGAGWPLIPENDFHNTHQGTRIQGWNQNLKSVINKEAPRSDYDFEKTVAKLKSPMIAHETGQWCVYPNFKEMEKYDGVLKPTNFEIFQKSIEAHGMLHLADDFVKASGMLQTLCYKADIEAALRTKGFSGFQLLDLSDFTGQGTALVGILDAFYEEKGYVTPKEFKQFCDVTVPLARFKKMIFTSDEKVACDVEIAHYGPQELKQVIPIWRIVDANGTLVKDGTLKKTDISWGHNIQLGSISELIEITEASKFQLQVDVEGFINTWDFWVYPSELPKVESDALVVSSFNEAAIATLENGGSVLLTVEKGSITVEKGGDVAVGFSSMFWNTAWTNGQKPHTLGILCDPTHPALAEFPTEYHSNWQWWDATSHSNAINIEGFENTPQPIVRIIDDWVTNRNLALVFEAKVGKGKLVMAGVDLQSALDKRPEARQMLYSLQKYMAEDSFNPQTKISVEEIRQLFN
ncbi:sugar-binding domain-containing protein [Carboxylicivirga sp. M1479]|uniref:sugar-binding domain-containing protein n=1 Tax=Carboxylicivirga sp. M1479 TaxID=2594476 RepID=UPI00117885C6|nr:sugar-binding domain-containing protein [Carboxylicivirga sp. M1479]TRX71151.1 beta-galactosidase [Carboxylicivirga sp. M1479]